MALKFLIFYNLRNVYLRNVLNILTCIIEFWFVLNMENRLWCFEFNEGLVSNQSVIWYIIITLWLPSICPCWHGACCAVAGMVKITLNNHPINSSSYCLKYFCPVDVCTFFSLPSFFWNGLSIFLPLGWINISDSFDFTQGKLWKLSAHTWVSFYYPKAFFTH